MDTKPASNNQVKQWKKLLMGKYRKKENKFLAEGFRCVEQINQNGRVTIEELLVAESALSQLDEWQIDAPVYTLSNDDFISVSDTENPQGVIAVCKTPPETDISKLGDQNFGLIAAFDAIQDPGNMGTMIRTASWFGVNTLIFGTGCVDPFHPKVVRSTAGATGTIPYLKGDLSEIFEELETNNWTVNLLDGSESAIRLQETIFDDKSVIVVGNEGSGINENLFSQHRKKIKIDGNPEIVESLNAAVAFSIAIHHAKLNI